MSDTQAILRKIAALRQRLDKAQGVVRDAPAAPVPLEPAVADPVERLEEQVAAGARHNALIEGALGPTAAATEAPALPRRLTARGARLLHFGRDLLGELRRLAEEPLLSADASEPLADLYRETAAMLDTMLRALPAFPEAAAAQARLCDGLEGVLGVVTERLGLLRASVAERRRQLAQVDRLMQLLEALAAERPLTVDVFVPLAMELHEDARHELPLRFLSASPRDPPRFVACHSMNVAQVIARLLHDDPEWDGRRHEPILAALLHDAGLVNVPAEILSHPGPLNDVQRRVIENHTRDGGHMLADLAQGMPRLIEAAVSHHERSDGTGYPDGSIEVHVSPLVRLLAVCDIYAALAAPRPYRAALEPRTALTDTLLLADQGAIDRVQAERLLRIGFYPLGSVVELSDGSAGVVVGSPAARGQRMDPSRPAVALVSAAHGTPLPVPRHVSLTTDSQRSVHRLMPRPERRQLLGKRYPLLA